MASISFSNYENTGPNRPNITGKRLHSSSFDDVTTTDTSPWKAMKRLRVAEVGEPPMHESKSTKEFDVEGVACETYDGQNQKISNGGGLHVNVAQEPWNGDIRYDNVNHMLNDLHKERTQRSRFDSLHQIDGSMSNSGNGLIGNDAHSSLPQWPSSHLMPNALKQVENQRCIETETGDVPGIYPYSGYRWQRSLSQVDHSAVYNNHLVGMAIQQGKLSQENSMPFRGIRSESSQSRGLDGKEITQPFEKVNLFSSINLEKHRKILRLQTNSNIG
jgi:hypothetical protein